MAHFVLTADSMSTDPPRPRVLVVDDDRLIGRAISRALRGVAAVTLEESPDAALERVRRGERFDLVLSDVTMPGMSGLELFQRVVGCAPEMRERFVFASGGMADDVKARLVATGRPCLEKPVSVEVILSLLRG